MTAVDRIIAWGDKTTLGIVYKAGPCPMAGMAIFPPTKYVRADLADALADALRETNQILSQCLFGTIRVNGQYLDREEVVARNATALAAWEGRK